jgi:anti-sigma factor RsiW
MSQTCREAVELVTDYLEGALDPATLQAFVAHLAECEDCEEFLRQLVWTIDALKTLECEQDRGTQRYSWP